jgi:hypothetical protein
MHGSVEEAAGAIVGVNPRGAYVKLHTGLCSLGHLLKPGAFAEQNWQSLSSASLQELTGKPGLLSDGGALRNLRESGYAIPIAKQ